MDQTTLVNSGQTLVRALDDAGFPPKAAMWVHNSETETWKLWIVPARPPASKMDFYRQISEIVSRRRSDLGGIDAADIEMIEPKHPAIAGLRNVIKAPGLTAAHLSNNRLNGYFLSDGIVLRMNV